VYFEEGILPTSSVTYMVYSPQAHSALAERISFWSRQGLAQEYLDDAINIISTYSRRHRIVFFDNFPKNINLHKLTLVSEGYWLLSERDKKLKKVCHGQKINWPLLIAATSIAVSGVSLVTPFGELLEILLGATAGIGAGWSLKQWHKQKMNKIARFAESATSLKKVIDIHAEKGERRISRKVATWLDKGFSMNS
jgi:hypothetical protein